MRLQDLGRVTPAHTAIDAHAAKQLRQWLCRKHRSGTGRSCASRTDSYGIDNEELDEPDEQRTLEVHRALLDIVGTLGAPATTQKPIRFTSRHGGVDGFERLEIGWSRHALPEYANPIGAALLPIPTISAYHEDSIDDGVLVMKRNHPSEYKNPIAGTVSSPLCFTGASLWSALVGSENSYCNDLDYAYPVVYGSNEFNSNGFAGGMIDSASGETNVPISSYFRG